MATSIFYIYVMATSFFYIYVIATSFFYIYIGIYIDIYFDIYKSTERPVFLSLHAKTILLKSTRLLIARMLCCHS